MIPQTLLRYVRDVLGEAVAAEVVERAGIGLTLTEAHTPGRWYGDAEVHALVSVAADMCGDPDIGRRAGERLFFDSMAAGMSDFLIASGSVEAAMEGVVAYGTKMSTGASFRVRSSREGEVIVDGEYANPGPSHAFYCGYTAGFYSQVPSLFGSTGWVAVPDCQARGAERCRYHLSWSPVSAKSEHGASPEQSKARSERMLARFEQLQSAAADLVGADDVDAVLDRVTERAGIAVEAPRYLLAVRVEEDDPLRVHHFGFDDSDSAHRWAASLLNGEAGEHDGVLIGQVRSARHDYGLLAAVYHKDATFSQADRRLIDAYAGHAAAALEVVASLSMARRERDSARATLELAREIALVGTREEITHRLAPAIAEVTRCDRSSVWLWDEPSDELVLAVTHDRNGAPERVPGSIRLSRADVTGLSELVESPRAGLVHVDEAQDPMRALMIEAGMQSVALVPIVTRAGFRGVVTAGYRRLLKADSGTAELLHRLDGVAHYAATALENAELLEQTRYQALHDDLTGLPNRALVQERAERALAFAARHGGNVGLLFIDLDRFKNINDSLGHAFGDELIRAAGARLARVVRDADTFARLGGDEFIVLLPGIAGPDDAAAAADRVLEALADPFLVRGRELFVSCSIGITCAPAHGTDYATLMSHADAAMYEAKALGRGTYAVHSSPELDRRQLLELESDLHKAVENGELRLFFQAQTDLATRRPVGVEALVRWEHPDLGLLPPGAFLPLAEESGLIVGIDRWVRRAAFAQGRAWLDAGTPVRIAVNVSSRDLANPEAFVADLASELRESRLPAEWVELEITDRVTMKEAELPVVLDGLRRLGVRLAIDDFGTGNSVLGRLQQCRVDTLKIDRSFVHGISAEGDDSLVVRALISLGHNLGLEIVAEGVETELQASVLRDEGCGMAQGFLFSRPVPGEEMTAELAAPEIRCAGARMGR